MEGRIGTWNEFDDLGRGRCPVVTGTSQAREHTGAFPVSCSPTSQATPRAGYTSSPTLVWLLGRDVLGTCQGQESRGQTQCPNVLKWYSQSPALTNMPGLDCS